MAPGQSWSKTWSFYEGDWHEGNIPIMGVRSHAAWLCSSVFDGARTFEGVAPDLDLHCARVNASATTMHLKPTVSAETVGLRCMVAAEAFTRAQCRSRSGDTPSKVRAPSNTEEHSQAACERTPMIGILPSCQSPS